MALEVNQRVLRDLKMTANVRHHPYLIVKDDKDYLGNFWSYMAAYPDHEMRHKKKVSLKALMMWLLSLYDEPNVNFQVLIAPTNRFIKQIVKKKWIKKKVWSKFLRVIYCLMDDIPALGEDGEMESSPGEVLGSFFNTLLESLCRHIVLFTTSYPMQMVEELISCWNRSDEPDAQMDFEWLPYIEVNMLLQQWSYLSNYKTETKPSLQPKSLAQAMGMEKIDTPTSSTYALGLPTIADASPSREFRSSDELDHQSLGSTSQWSTSPISSSTQCYTPGSCVYLKSAAHPSTSHLLQIRVTEVEPDPRRPGMHSGRLVTRLSVPISQQANIRCKS